MWKINSVASTFSTYGVVNLRRWMLSRDLFTVNNHVLRSCSYRPREMSSKKPVSRLRQVIPVKKRVSNISFAITKAYIEKLKI